MLLFYFLTSSELVSPCKRQSLFDQTPQNRLVSQEVDSLCDSHLHPFDVVQFSGEGSSCYPYSSFHLHIPKCTCILSKCVLNKVLTEKLLCKNILFLINNNSALGGMLPSIQRDYRRVTRPAREAALDTARPCHATRSTGIH
jgi:hypothetical protein